MRETLEGYDHTKYNVNKRMTQFKGKVEKIFTDIYSLREVIKHIPSVGEPYFMAARKRRKTAFDNKRSLLQIDSSNDIIARIRNAESKNPIKEKADKK